MVRKFWPICIMLFYFSFCNISKFKHFCIALLDYYIWYFLFLNTRFLFSSYTYVPIESIDYIPFTSFELKAIVLISYVKTVRLSFSLFHLCCVFSISLLFSYILFHLRLSTSNVFCSKWFILFSIWVASRQFL